MITIRTDMWADLYLRLSIKDLKGLIEEGKVTSFNAECEKDLESGSIETQRAYLTRYCKENGINIHKIHVDDGYSGANFDRPGWKNVIKDIEEGNINTVIVKDLSRLGRISSKVTYYTDEYFPEKNIRFIAVEDAIDSGTSGVSGEETAQFKAFFNEWYVRDCSKKVRAGKKARAKEGKVMTTYPSYGYKKDINDKNHYIVDEESGTIVKEIFALAKEGKTPTQIARIMTEKNYRVPSEVVGNKHTRTDDEIKRGWNKNTIKRILKNQVYLGHVVNCKARKINYKSKKVISMPNDDWIIVKNQHEPLVDQETFDIVQQLIKSRTRTRKRKHEWLLCGILKCEECGKNLSIINPNSKDIFYTRCNTYAQNTAMRICTPHTNKLDTLTDAILKSISDTVKVYLKNQEENYMKIAKNEYQKLMDNENTIKKEIRTLNNKKALIQKKIDSLYEDKVNNLLDSEDFKRIYKNAKKDKTSVEAQIKLLQDSINKEEKTIDFDDIVNKFINMKNIDRTTLVQLVDKITVNKEKEVKIHYTFNVLNDITRDKEAEVVKIKNSKKILKVS